jgi:transcriptional regulator with XRE-family HTH domain
LRKAKGFTLEQLAERARIDKQTVWRLEKGDHTTVRESTLQKLARALSVEPPVLTGETALPETEEDEGYPSDLSKLKFPISTSAYNAIYLASERYRITHQDILELAPFLFCWAAEASLRQRRERLKQAQHAYENARNVEREMRHFRPSDSTDSEEKFAAESESIASPDLFGILLDNAGFGPPLHDEHTDNPFAIFLNGLAEEIGGQATFDGYGAFDYPFYRVCVEDAERLVGGDAELTEAILEGHVALAEMPKGIVGQYRAQWVRTRFEEHRNRVLRFIERRRKADEASS